MRALFFLLISTVCAVAAPIKIGIIGSSTARGLNATDYNHAWAGLYTIFITNQNAANSVVNVAVSGSSTYNGLPTGTINPPGRPSVDTNDNITGVLSFSPNGVIVNYPSNDAVNGYSEAETETNLLIIAATCLASNVPVWIATTQPRNFGGRTNLIHVKDWILANFPGRSLDFWTGLANSDGTMVTNYDSGDGAHFNNAGHAVLYNRVVASGLYDILVALRTYTLQLVSTENASGYRDNVNFTIGVRTNGTIAGNATGMVVFLTNGVAWSTNTVSGGSATSASVNNLPRGTNLITAWYSGDVNYLSNTNTLLQVVTNHPPSVGAAGYNRGTQHAWTIQVSDLLTNASDVDGDSLKVTVGTSTNNITPVVTAGQVQYYNPNQVNDQFIYTVSDGFGGTNSAVITLVASNIASQLQLNSTENASGYRDLVNFSAGVQTNGFLAGDAGGTVVFLTNGVMLGMSSVSGGSVTSASVNNLPRGTNIITAWYSGDMNYLGSSNAFAQVVTNHPPVAGVAGYSRGAQHAWAIAISDLLTNASDVDGDSLNLSVGMSTNNIALVVNGGQVQYFNPNQVNDQFTYTVSDGFGGTNSAMVTLTACPAAIQLQVASTEDASGFQDNVSFMAGVQTNGLTAGDASGEVVFLTNGVPLGTNNLNDGSAASERVNNLPRGTNIITAWYSGDVNYLGSTNALAQVVTNHPPVANAAAYDRGTQHAWTIQLSDLLTNASDVDGDSLGLNVGISTNNITLVVSGGQVRYYNPNQVNDQFSYIVSDGFGGTNSAVVSLSASEGALPAARFICFTNNMVNLIFQGVPNYCYVAQRTTNLVDFFGWVDFATNTASTDGVVNIDDLFPDLNGIPPMSVYYRLHSQP